MTESAKELSRGQLVPTIRGEMLPAYEAAWAESGTGALARMKGLVEDRVRLQGGAMLQTAAGGLRAWMGGQVQQRRSGNLSPRK